MKKLIRLKIIILFTFLVSCSEDDQPIATEEEYVVDKIFDYNYNLLAQYHYNDDNQLVKRITTDPINERKSDYEFEYSDGRISKIIYIDYNFPQFNHSIQVYYNDEGKIYKDETYQNGYIVSARKYTFNLEGKINGMESVEGEPKITFLYQETENIVQVKVLYPDNGDISNNGDYVEKIYEYTYDNHPQPNFGIDKIFQFEPLPYFGTEALFQKNLSKNNMVSYGESGTKWIYTYNENDLPQTIETKWHEVETEEPMLLRITYKEITQ